MGRIFVSYRRDDSEGEAGRIADKLHEAFGKGRVFFDSAAMRGGERWRERIDAALVECDVMLVVIGRRWLTVTAGDGQPRLAEADDVVAYEISTALARKVRLIPVLVQRAPLPAATDLPAPLRGILEYQAREVRADAFDRDMAALTRDVAGGRLLLRPRVLVGTALGVAAIVGALWWVFLFEPPEAPPKPVDLRLRVRPAAAGLTAGAPATPASAAKTAPEMRLYHRLPIDLGTVLLPPPRLVPPGVYEYTGRLANLPFKGERYEGDLHRLALEGFEGSPKVSLVCFTAAPKASAAERTVRLTCTEGEPCQIASDDFGLARACDPGGQPRASWNVVPIARAQSTQPRRAAPEGWIIPSLETLRQRHAGPDAPAYSEITLTSGPLRDLPATRVSVQVQLNGRMAWIDGLPADASAVPFDPAKGVRAQFGIENLGFSGAHRGKEHIDLALRFLNAKGLVREVPVRLEYIALRPHPDPTPVGDPALGLRWTAQYFPRPADRYQVFMSSQMSPEEAERFKVRFDGDPRSAIRLGGAEHRLVAVIRPPLPGGKDFGLIVGLRQPTGQIRFSFDDRTSAEVCRELVQIKSPLVRRDSFRRNIEDQSDSQRCASFGPA